MFYIYICVHVYVNKHVHMCIFVCEQEYMCVQSQKISLSRSRNDRQELIRKGWSLLLSRFGTDEASLYDQILFRSRYGQGLVSLHFQLRRPRRPSVAPLTALQFEGRSRTEISRLSIPKPTLWIQQHQETWGGNLEMYMTFLCHFVYDLLRCHISKSMLLIMIHFYIVVYLL